MMTVGARLHAYMKQHRLTRQKMADALSTPVKTMDSWLYSGITPPAVMIPMLDMIEKRSQVRSWLGLSRGGKKLARGRPFPRGHPYRFGDPRREAALREARKRKAKPT